MFRVRTLASAFLTCVFFSAIVSAQSNLASISGVITDPKGGVNPQATVNATDVATGVQTAATTNSTGFYRLQNLPIGAYRVAVEHSGFHKYIRKDIVLTTGQEFGLDVKLELGATGQV